MMEQVPTPTPVTFPIPYCLPPSPLFACFRHASWVIVAGMRFGSLNLESNLFLSPLAGYTNLPFRLVVREIGGVGLCTTDLVNARSLLEKREKAYKLIETCPADSPLAVQLFGSVPEEMRDAAVVAEARGAVSVILIWAARSARSATSAAGRP
jgi:hypothetical protein